MKTDIKYKRIKFIMAAIITIGIMAVSKYTFAASVSVTASKSSINIGDTVTVSASIKDTEAWNLKLSASGGELSGTTEDADSAGSEVSKNVLSANFKASEKGTYTIKLSGQITGSDLKKQTVSESIDITVNEKKETNNTGNNSNNNSNTTKSSNANLKTLGVTPKQYDFSGFNKNKTKYSVTVPANVDSLKVIAKTEDSKASLKITGNTGFDVGSDNNIKIVVTAEDKKTTKTYEINVTKLAEEEEKPGNVIEEDEDLYLTSLEIEGIELTPEFSKDVYSYSANLNDENLTSVKVKAKANIDKANIETTGNTNLVEGENTINVVVTNGDKKVTYQIILTKALTTTTTIGENQNSSSSNNLIESIKNYAIIAIVIVILIIVAIIVLICLIRKENKKLNQQQDNEEYNVYANDKDEFKKAGSPYKDAQIDRNIKEALEEINKDNEETYNDVTGQNVEYESKQEEQPKERRRGKGKH